MRELKWIWLGLMLGFVGVAYATMPKTWSNGDKVAASDLNSNFAHTETYLKGAGHTLIVNADISGSAVIAHSKLATPALLPKAMATIGVGAGASTACAAGTCTLAQNSGLSSVTWGSTGNYTVTLSQARANAVYAGVVMPHTSANCYTDTYTTSSFAVHCQDLATPSAANAAFTVLVYDVDN
jgi:hypothetical protein